MKLGFNCFTSQHQFFKKAYIKHNELVQEVKNNACRHVFGRLQSFMLCNVFSLIKILMHISYKLSEASLIV